LEILKTSSFFADVFVTAVTFPLASIGATTGSFASPKITPIMSIFKTYLKNWTNIKTNNKMYALDSKNEMDHGFSSVVIGIPNK
jgi:hypothetical protein